MSHSHFCVTLLNGTAIFLIPSWISPPLMKWALWIVEGIVLELSLEGRKLGWGGSGERLGSREGTGQREVARAVPHLISSALDLGGAVPIPGATINHLLATGGMPAYSHQCCVSVLDSVGLLWESTENTILYLTSLLSRMREQLQLSYQQPSNDRAFLEFSWVCQGRNKEKPARYWYANVSQLQLKHFPVKQKATLCLCTYCFLCLQCLQFPSFQQHPTNPSTFSHTFIEALLWARPG